jgi:hypothetical protein
MAIMANFLATTMNCSIQKLLIHSPLLRNVAVFFLIYFTINFTSSNNIYPPKLWINVLMVYGLFILLMKQNIYFLVANLTILVLIYTSIQLRDYYLTQNDIESGEIAKQRIVILDTLFFITLLVGFVSYASQQYQTNHADFSWVKFLFGANVCDPMKA